MKERLPEEYEVLAELTSDLPGEEVSPVAPFLSIVINLNVSTLGHRDRFDKDLCLVLALGEFTGGAMVMYEQGLVLPLRCGDFTLFCSPRTTHFNLRYEGIRGSFVFHTDKSFEKWQQNKNGWESNTYFH